MRTFARKEVNEKIRALLPQTRSSLALIIGFFESKRKEEIVESKSSPYVMQLPGGIYVARIQDTHTYFSFGADSEGDYLMILDVTETRKQPVASNFFAVKDPRTNSTLNPQYNTSINPNFNTAINPRFNTAINPRFNTAINPNFNTSINPNFNTAINPRFNTSINPNFNTAINPRFNMSINPRFNPAYGGPFLYSLDLRQEGYLVRANERVSIIFDMNGEFTGFTVQHDSGVILTFDANNEWIGYMVPSGQDPFLRFDESGDWIGILV